MAIPESQNRAVHNYKRRHYDRMELTVPKGTRAEIRAAAETVGQSVNAFIVQAVRERMERLKVEKP